MLFEDWTVVLFAGDGLGWNYPMAKGVVVEVGVEDIVDLPLVLADVLSILMIGAMNAGTEVITLGIVIDIGEEEAADAGPAAVLEAEAVADPVLATVEAVLAAEDLAQEAVLARAEAAVRRAAPRLQDAAVLIAERLARSPGQDLAQRREKMALRVTITESI